MLRKLFRTMGLYKSQFISMVIMIALGIGVFVGFNMEWYTIESDTSSFFEDTHLADFRVMSEKGFSEEDAEKIASIDGVERAARFLSVNMSVDGGDDKLAVTVTSDANVSGFLLMSGEAYDEGSEDGIWLSDRYAQANGLELGDELTLGFRGLEFDGTVKGLVKSGEYLICIPDATQLMPDYDTYGFAYVSPKALEKLLGAEYYSQINVLSDMEKADFVEAADEALGETLVILSKEDTPNYAEAMGESEEGKTMGSVLPVLFLAIAVLTMVTTMHRLTASEKTQIGTFKALGFHDSRIMLHYSSYALMIGLIGTGLGIGLGIWLCWFIMNPDGSMGTYFDMPDWSLHTPRFVWYVLVLINAFMLLIGFLSVRSMLKGTAADALRPYTPKKVRAVLLERFPIWDRLSFGTRWNLRDCLRHKSRSLMTLIGVAGCILLLYASFGMEDTLDTYIDRNYNEAMGFAYKINLDSESCSNEEAAELAEELGAAWLAQSSVQIDGAPYLLEIYGNNDSGLVGFLDGDLNRLELDDSGAFVCRRIAESFGLEKGSELSFSPYGGSETYTMKVAGIISSMTESFAMTESCANSLGLDYTVNTIYSPSAPEQEERILNVQSKQAIIDSFDTFREVMDTMVILLVAAAVILGIVVLYNLGVMSYTERYREMATLKVIGFRDALIGRLLISQNLWITVLGVLAGLPAAHAVLSYLLEMLASEYELRVMVRPSSVAICVGMTFAVSLLVGLMISRKNRHIDMVEALKGQEG